MIRLLLPLALAGCAHTITEYPEQPAMTQPCDQINRVTLHVEWAKTPDEVTAKCGMGQLAYGCNSRPSWTSPEGEIHAYLVMIPPRDFNDHVKLAIMGHELCHALGGRHDNGRG